MTHFGNSQSAATNDIPGGETVPDFDTFYVDDAFDDFRDGELFAIRESLADFRTA
jgi:hypothetical protein